MISVHYYNYSYHLLTLWLDNCRYHDFIYNLDGLSDNTSSFISSKQSIILFLNLYYIYSSYMVS